MQIHIHNSCTKQLLYYQSPCQEIKKQGLINQTCQIEDLNALKVVILLYSLSICSV